MNLEKVRNVLPNRVRSFRNSKIWTQERLAEEVDIHTTYVSRIESGKKFPALFIICKIADALGVNTYELLMDEVKLKSTDYKLKKLVSILNQSSPFDIDICTALLNMLYREHKRGKK